MRGRGRNGARAAGLALWAAALAAGCGREGTPPAPPAPAADPEGAPAPVASGQAPAWEPEARALERALPAAPAWRPGSAGPAAPPLPEPTTPLRRAEPEQLLGSALEALEREDLAALARLSRSPRRAARLSEDDALDARLAFLTPAARQRWARIRAALAQGAWSAHPRGPDALELRVEVGGAVGTYRIELHREEDGWYLDG